MLAYFFTLVSQLDVEVLRADSTEHVTITLEASG